MNLAVVKPVGEGPRNARQSAAQLAPQTRLLVAAALSGLVLVTVMAYIPALRAGFIWDDDDYIVNNANLRTLSGLARTWTEPQSLPQWYPLVHTTFWIEYHLWGASPAGYHAVNVVLHAINALLLLKVLLRVGIAAPAAALAAAVFALHPVQVESVAWATERKNLLSGALYLLAALAYLRFEPPQRLFAGDRPRDWAWWAASWGLFLGALLSKSVTATMPAAMLVILWWKQGRLRWRQVWPLLPFFATGAVISACTVWLEKHHVGAAGVEFALSPLDRVLLAGRVPWFYVLKLLVPFNLAFIYPRWHIDAGSAWQYLFPLGTAGALIALRMLRGRIGREALAAALLFVGTLLPVLGFFDVYPFRYSYVADHFQYLACIAPIVLFSSGVWRLLGAMPETTAGKALGCTGAVLLLVLAVLTWRQCTIFRDPETLWSQTLMRSPNAWLAHENLGVIQMERGQYAEAQSHFRRAIEIQEVAPKPHFNLGKLYVLEGRDTEAKKELQRALQLDPGYAKAYEVTADVERKEGQTVNAITLYEKAVALEPRFVEARVNYATALVDAGRLDDGLCQFQEAMRQQPSSLDATFDCGCALLAAGRSSAALGLFERAVQLDPGCIDAWYYGGVTLETLGRRRDATAAFRRTLALDPGFERAAAELRRLVSAPSVEGRNE